MKLLTEEDRKVLEDILSAAFGNGGQCPFCSGFGVPEPDRDWHEPHCKTHQARQVLECDRDISSSLVWLNEIATEMKLPSFNGDKG